MFEEENKPQMDAKQEKSIVKILKAVKSIWAGVGEAAATAAAIGAVQGGIAAYSQARQELNIKKQNQVLEQKAN